MRTATFVAGVLLCGLLAASIRKNRMRHRRFGPVDIEPTYENVYAVCPQCGRRNIFNRVTDLGTTEPIAGKAINCESADCDVELWITNDRINPAHEALLFDCRELLERKQYMQTVLTVSQAFEVFFSHFLHVQVLYRTYANEGAHDVPRLNVLLQSLYEHTKTYTFEPMRSLFLDLAAAGTSFATLNDAGVWIDMLPARAHVVKKPKRTVMEAVPSEHLRNLLLALYEVEVASKRNQVVHKQAYRPTAVEASDCLEEASAILLPLTRELDLGGDATWYLSKAGR